MLAWLACERIYLQGGQLNGQLRALLKASLLITVHGAAMVMAAFLLPGAIAVEMMPLGFTTDFHHGYANWPDMASVSHVVWHEQGSMQHIGIIGADMAGVSQPCGKYADGLVTEAFAADMLQTAHLIWMTILKPERLYKVPKQANSAPVRQVETEWDLFL